MGTFTAPGGAPTYTGEGRDGMRNGHGVLTFDKEGKAKYAGGWKDDLKHGRGTMISSSGNVYEPSCCCIAGRRSTGRTASAIPH